MGLKFSMAEDRNISPYILKNGIKVYSLEEAIYLFYKNFKEYSNDFFEDTFISWVYDELLDINIADKLLKLKQQKNFYQKSMEFLTINEFYTLDEIENISLELFNWGKKGQVEVKKAKADRLFNDGMFKVAINVYKEVLNFDVTNPILYNNIGICYIRIKEYDLALRYLKKANSIDDNNKDILFNLIEILLQLGNFEEAIIFIYKIEKDNVEKLFYYLGELDFLKRNYGQAIANFSKSYLLKTEDNIIIKIAECHIKKGDVDKLFNCLNFLDSNDVDILVKKSIIFEKINNIPMAIKCIEKANFYNRDNFRLWTMLARYYRKEYNILKAEGAIAKAFILAPEDDTVLLEKALIKRANKKFREYKDIVFKIIQKTCKNYRKGLYINYNNEI